MWGLHVYHVYYKVEPEKTNRIPATDNHVRKRAILPFIAIYSENNFRKINQFCKQHFKKPSRFILSKWTDFGR